MLTISNIQRREALGNADTAVWFVRCIAAPVAHLQLWASGSKGCSYITLVGRAVGSHRGGQEPEGGTLASWHARLSHCKPEADKGQTGAGYRQPRPMRRCEVGIFGAS